MLKPGTYRLTHDVVNPTPDRRKKDDWRALVVWRAGTEFLITEHTHDLPPDLDEGTRARLAARTYVQIRAVASRWSFMTIGAGDTKQYAALMPALEPCMESLAAMYARLGVTNDYFAKWLVESGRLNREDFERLWQAHQQDGGLTGEERPRAGRRLVEEPSDEELGIEPAIDALNRIATQKGGSIES